MGSATGKSRCCVQRIGTMIVESFQQSFDSLDAHNIFPVAKNLTI
jgi:hypothetical protein